MANAPLEDEQDKVESAKGTLLREAREGMAVLRDRLERAGREASKHVQEPQLRLLLEDCIRTLQKELPTCVRPLGIQASALWQEAQERSTRNLMQQCLAPTERKGTATAIITLYQRIGNPLSLEVRINNQTFSYEARSKEEIFSNGWMANQDWEDESVMDAHRERYQSKKEEPVRVRILSNGMMVPDVPEGVRLVKVH